MLYQEMTSLKMSDGLELRYVVDDFTDPWHAADTLILLHAAMGSSRRLYAWVPHLCRHVRVVRPDLRGHGKSGIPAEGQLTLDRLRDDILELMDHLNLERAHIAGSSAGGIIAMYTAVTHADCVASLAAFAAIPGLKMSAGHTDYGAWMTGIRTEGVHSFLKRTIGTRFDLDQVDPGFVDWFLDEAARNDPELLCRFVGLMSSTDFSDRVGEIKCPTLAVVPGGDPNQSMDEYAVLRDNIRNCKFVVYPGMPHNITDAVPDRCAQELRDFLLELQA